MKSSLLAGLSLLLAACATQESGPDLGPSMYPPPPDPPRILFLRGVSSGLDVQPKDSSWLANAVIGEEVVDEKPMQILKRRYPTRVGPHAVVRREYEYRRGGTCQLLGAYDVSTGRMHGRVVKRRDAAALISFLDEVVRRYPGRTIYVVWDNLNLHLDGRDARWTRFARQHRGRIRFVYTPLHASWVNQIEIWFSILQRRVLRYGSFENRAELRRDVLSFIRHWNERLAHPFRWTFSGRFEENRRAA